MDIKIKTIPAYEGYTSTFQIKSFDECFTDDPLDNVFYSLENRMRAGNPEVKMRGEDEMYLFFAFDEGVIPKPPFTLHYYDLVYNKGKDGDGYRFVDIPSVDVAYGIYTGYYDTVGNGVKEVFDWIKAEGYEICGKTRAAITEAGPWEPDLPKDLYRLEIQVPIRKNQSK